MHFKRRFVFAVTLLCFSCVHVPFAEAHEVSENVKNMEGSHGSPKLRSNGKKHRNDDDDDDDGDSLPLKQKLPGGTLVAPINTAPNWSHPAEFTRWCRNSSNKYATT